MSTTTFDTPVADEQALEIARGVAQELEKGSAERDLNRTLLWDEFKLLKESGVLGFPVPTWFGGPGVTLPGLFEVLRILGRAEPNAGQILVIHYSSLALALWSRREDRAHEAPEAWRSYADAAVQGRLHAGAHSERGGIHAIDIKTRLTGPAGGPYRLNGTKYYSTGALYADALSISAINDDGDLVMIQLPADAPGVELRDDWNGIGQRLTGSGTTVLSDVVVEERQVGVMKARRAPTASNDIFEDGPTGGLTAAACTGFHAALTVGIARAAFEDGVWFLREKARPWVYTGVERAADEPFLLKIEGELQTQLHAAEALLERAARLVDQAYQTLTAADVLAARVAVAEAKAFGSEAGLRIASDIFTLGGTGSTDRKYNLDRHWRNLRTHETHDATRWLYFHVGNALVNNAAPPATGKI